MKSKKLKHWTQKLEDAGRITLLGEDILIQLSKVDDLFQGIKCISSKIEEIEKEALVIAKKDWTEEEISEAKKVTFNSETVITQKMTEGIFANDFHSWQETHFEIVSYLNRTVDIVGSFALKIMEKQGTGGLYEIAMSLTNEFELKFKGKEWDGDFLDEIDKFLEEKEVY